MNNSTETDVIAMDPSKAFDTVPYRRLMERLGISTQLITWIENFSVICY